MTKMEIIQAAFTAWGREFYRNTSLSQVARELGVSKPALYRHFCGKQALLNAMAAHFFDDFAAFIRAAYERAVNCEDSVTSVSLVLRATAEYYARNADAFIFSLVMVYDRENDGRNSEAEFKARGVDMGLFLRLMAKDYSLPPPLGIHLGFSTIMFFIASFHKDGREIENFPSEAAIAKRIDTINEIIERGLGYSSADIDALDFEELENRWGGGATVGRDDPLLKAVASVVAATGPWKASMEQVARSSGLSKSSLYCHFKSKEDMLRQFFTTEFARIIDFTEQGMRQSEVPAERLYLGVYSIAAYLRSRPEILAAMDWIRTRKLDPGSFMAAAVEQRKGRDAEPTAETLPPEFLQLFADIEIKPLHNEEGSGQDRLLVSHWMLFLIISLLMRQGKAGNVQNGDIRQMFRFLTLGIGGYKK